MRMPRLLLAAEGPTLMLENSSIAGFPAWVMWTFRPNHHETEHISVGAIWHSHVARFGFTDAGGISREAMGHRHSPHSERNISLRVGALVQHDRCIPLPLSLLGCKTRAKINAASDSAAEFVDSETTSC